MRYYSTTPSELNPNALRGLNPPTNAPHETIPPLKGKPESRINFGTKARFRARTRTRNDPAT